MASKNLHTSTVSLKKTLRSIMDKPYEQGYSLPGAFYTDADWMRTECEELFARDWFCCRVEEVANPGDYFAFDHIGEPLLIVHGRDGARYGDLP